MPIRSTSGQEHVGEFFAYVRVSTDKQDNDRQRKEIRDWLNGGEHTVHWYSDHMTGTVHPDMREGLAQCIRDCRKAKGTIILSDIDRFSRTAWQTLQFFDEKVQRGKIKLVVVNDPLITENALGLQMKTLIAEGELKKIQERTKSKLDFIKEEMSHQGHYITKDGKKITKLGADTNVLAKARDEAKIVIERQADVFAEKMKPLLKYYTDQDFTYQQIADELNTRQEKTRRGGEWYPSTVRNLIKRLMGE